ncbi:MAG: hypothetical protein ACJ790_13335, partial [Myxococcaceae bacterium]
IEARLRERGLLEESIEPIQMSGVEPRVDPLSFNLRALEENVDPTVGLPLQTHRGGISGQSVIFVKQSFRRFGKIVINELLARQRVFNGHVLDSYAQLSAEVLRLREEVARLKAEQSARAGLEETSVAAGSASDPKRSPPTKKWSGSKGGRGRKR